MYQAIYDCLRRDLDTSQILLELKSHQALANAIKEITEDDRARGRNFSSETKNAIVIKSAIESAPKCAICHARLNPRSATIDHIRRREDGGTGSLDNGQLTHPYCNSGYKEHLNSRVRRDQAALS